MANKLTALMVRKVSRPGKYGDGNGLMLLVTATGAKCWVQRLMIQGRRRDIGLGGFPLVSLAEARKQAFENRKLARAGGDPMALREQARVPTFREALESVLDIQRATWRNSGKSEAQWRSSLETYAMPRLGRMPVNAITVSDVMAVLVPIWNTKRETARRVRQRIGAICKWAVASGYRHDNPAGEAIGAALPKNGVTKTHHKAMPYSEVAGALATIRESHAGITTKLAFELLVLTAARSGEVRLATWTEIDLEAGTWTVPGGRMKGGLEHRVPLSARAVAILREAAQYADGSGLIFPSPTGKALSDSTLSKLCRENGVQAVPHGFRSSFRVWASERTSTPREIMEAALAHKVRNKVEAAYSRSDHYEKRARLMDLWAQYLTGDAAKVVAIS